MASTQDRTEFISEVVNLLAGPVTAGMKKAGEANQRRMEMQQHLEQIVDDARRAGDVARRMVSLLDEIEQPLREAVPQFARAAQMLGQLLDEAPDDLASQMRSTWSSVNSLIDGLGPLLLLAQGAAGMFGGATGQSSTVSARQTPAAKKSGVAKKASASSAPSTAKRSTAPAKKAPSKKASTVQKAPAKKRPAAAKKSSAAKKSAAKK